MTGVNKRRINTMFRMKSKCNYCVSNTSETACNNPKHLFNILLYLVFFSEKSKAKGDDGDKGEKDEL